MRAGRSLLLSLLAVAVMGCVPEAREQGGPVQTAPPTSVPCTSSHRTDFRTAARLFVEIYLPGDPLAAHYLDMTCNDDGWTGTALGRVYESGSVTTAIDQFRRSLDHAGWTLVVHEAGRIEYEGECSPILACRVSVTAEPIGDRGAVVDVIMTGVPVGPP